MMKFINIHTPHSFSTQATLSFCQFWWSPP